MQQTPTGINQTENERDHERATSNAHRGLWVGGAVVLFTFAALAGSGLSVTRYHLVGAVVGVVVLLASVGSFIASGISGRRVRAERDAAEARG